MGAPEYTIWRRVRGCPGMMGAKLSALSMAGTQKAMVTRSAAIVASTGPGAKSRTMT